jgi:hypothetical protein
MTPEFITREVSGYRAWIDEIEARLLEVEHVNAGLGAAALPRLGRRPADFRAAIDRLERSAA